MLFRDPDLLEAGFRDAAVSRETLRVVLPYVVVAALWIYFSDVLVAQLAGDMATGALWSTVKGLAFVAVTATMLWVLLSRRLRRLADARHALAAERTRLRTVLNTIPDLVWLKDTAGRYLTCNPAFERFIGVREAELVGKDDFAFFDPERAEFFRGHDAHALQAGASAVISARVTYRSDGREALLEVVNTPMPDGRGGYLGVLGIARDVTRVRETADALEATDRQFRGALDAARLGTWRYDVPTGKVTLDARCSAHFGLDRAEAHIDEVVSRLTPADRARLTTDIAGALDDPTGRARAAEYRVRHPDGTERWLSVHIQAEGRRDAPDGRPAAMYGITQDVTERVQLEEQFRQSQKLEAIGRLAGGVAHDFNNILTVIAGNSDMLAESLPPGSVDRTMLGEIRDATERAAGLTHQLLAFSRSQVLAPAVISLNAAVRRMEAMLRRLIGEDIDLRCVLSPATGHVRVDPGQLEQVILNLAVNARDAMPRGGRLTIETGLVGLDERFVRMHPGSAVGRHAQLTITDTGEGMEPDVKARAFEPFFTTKPPGKGTGLGLATVFGIVKQSGGHIELDTEPGSGSRFSIYLPAVAPEPAATTPGSTGEAHGLETVLLVEDEEGVRRVARVALESRGYKVVDAADGRAALHLMDAHGDDIVLLITDLVMPQMSGRELADLLRARRPGLKVLFMSGYVEDALVREGIVEQDEAFIHKPFSLIDLTRRVREVLDRP